VDLIPNESHLKHRSNGIKREQKIGKELLLDKFVSLLPDISIGSLMKGWKLFFFWDDC